ncbi:MAG TPA: SDR family oxidoreductase [Candidatus Angelobacter sp.]|jgi:NAD(P)-dependent dehydrogenase (short-subunit alcohol dehydrogenase family)
MQKPSQAPADTEKTATKVVLVTGASSGIGRACAEHLAGKGMTVYGASRSLSAGKTGSFRSLRIDVTEDTSVSAAVQQIYESHGRIDVVINNAGNGIAGAVEETSSQEALAQLNTNFFGVHRVCRAVLPIMREQRGGVIINVSSLAGLLAVPYQAFYSASKFAVEGLTEALRMEVKPFGIRVALIEPGDFKTDFPANRRNTVEAEKSQVYRELVDRCVGVMQQEEKNGMDPLIVARLAERIIHDPSPRLRYTTGPMGERIGPKLKSILPYRIYEYLFMKHYKLA